VSLAIIFSSFLVTFREAFEAILLMVILISYLKKTDEVFLIKPAYMGARWVL
jgi:high-affinity Fe2+/Pb2+ permease